MKDHEAELLREYVRALLNEDDTGGAGYGGYGGMGGFGSGGYGRNYGSSLKSVFIDPFLDAGKVIKASGSKMLLRMKTLAKVAIETILSTMIPFLQSNYTAIFKNEAEELKKLREKYKANFAAVDRAFSGDALLVSFMISPEAFIGVKFAQKAPEVAVEILETLAVGNESLVRYFADVKKRLQLINKELKDDISNYKVNPQGGFVRRGARGPYMTQKKRELMKRAGITSTAGVNAGLTRDGKLVEAAQADPRATLVIQVLKDPNVIRMLSQSPVVVAMKQDVSAVTQRLSQNVLQEARRTLSARTLQDLEKITGRPVSVPGLEKLQGPDRASLEEATLTQVKAAMKEFYVTTLKNEIAKLEGQGVDSNNLYIKTLNDTLVKVTAL